MKPFPIRFRPNQEKYDVKLRPSALNMKEVVIYGKSQEQVIRESPEAVSVINIKELQGRSVSPRIGFK